MKMYQMNNGFKDDLVCSEKLYLSRLGRVNKKMFYL